MIKFVPIEKECLPKMKQWRNKYINYLRQKLLLNTYDQEKWFLSDYLKNNILRKG